MDEIKEKDIVLTEDDMLHNASKVQVLTLKGLEKQVNEKLAEVDKKLQFLNRRIDIIGKSLRG